MNKIELKPKYDESGDLCEDIFVYSIQDRCDCGPFVPAKVLEECRSQGLPYVCLIIPGLHYNIVIVLDEPEPLSYAISSICPLGPDGEQRDATNEEGWMARMACY